jgi:hypothetical protein
LHVSACTLNQFKIKNKNTMTLLGIILFVLVLLFSPMTRRFQKEVNISGLTWLKTGVGIFLAIVLTAVGGIFFMAEPGTAYAVQYPWGGDAMVTTQGVKVKWWGRTIPLSYEMSIKDIIPQTNQDGEQIRFSNTDSEKGIYNRMASNWEFSDAIKAKIATSVIVGIDIQNEDKFLQMADKNRSESKLIYGRVLPNIDQALKNTAKLMDAQEYISGKASDFDRYFRDQLENGMYQVEEYTDFDKTPEIIGDTATVRTINGTRGNSSRQKKYKIKEDAQGNIIRDNTNTLKQYGIVIYQANVTGIDWEDSFDTRLDLQKDEVAKTQLEKQEAERQYYTAQKNVAQAESNKAKRRGELELKQVEQTIAAETEAKVAEFNLAAEKKIYEVEKFKALSKKVAADAIYYENSKRVQAGLTPQERATLEKEVAIGVAQELAKIKFPETLVITGSGTGKEATGLLETLIGAEMAKGMINSKKGN